MESSGGANKKAGILIPAFYVDFEKFWQNDK
jgi:hypothetical protein